MSGLSVVRPLKRSALADDTGGWNFGSGWPPSYQAFGRMRALMAFADATALEPVSVLEVAAGDASLCASLAKEGCRVVANDLRNDELERAVRNFENAEQIQAMPGNLFDLDPFVTGTFDLVIACEIVEHVAHTVDFLRQLRRFVAPGGHILLTTPNGSYFRNKLPTYSMVKDFTTFETQQFKPDADGHLFLITPSEMMDLARGADLTVAHIGLWGTPFLTGHVKLSHLSSKWLCWLGYHTELLAQWLPAWLRAKLCCSLCVIFKASQPMESGQSGAHA